MQALATPPPAEERAVDVDGRSWRALAWGDPGNPPVLLAHGIGSNAGVWWRVGPALAAAGRRAIAVDMPGHGPGAISDGRHRFVQTAADLAGFIRGAELGVPELGVVGHSWGGIVVAHLPQVGIRPAALVLVDPPWLSLERLEALIRDPSERRYDSFEQARAAVRSSNPEWSDADVAAKARALTEFDEAFVRDALLENGAFDAGMSALRHPDARRVRVWLIHGESSAGGLIPDEVLPAVRAQVGHDRVIAIAGAAHSPHRTHPESTVRAILRSLGPTSG
jgi:pimeloyl-ACP methyl ester carboxylesterase